MSCLIKSLDQEVEKSYVGEKIGEVERNIVDMDVEENLVEVILIQMNWVLVHLNI